MKPTFKTFNAKLFEGNDYSIPHIEDLEVEAFIRAIESLGDLVAVQKLDGANLRLGLDQKGELYTSREQKGGLRFYEQRDFPNTSAYDGFRAAHEVIQKISKEIKQVLAPGEAVNLEVIYGAQPNTVMYGKDGFNYLAFLEMSPGDDPSKDLNQGKVKSLNALLKDKTFQVETVASDTTDGEIIARAPIVSNWKMTVSDRVSREHIAELDFSQELQGLKKLLNKDNAAAKEQGRDLTNFEVLKDRSQKLTQEKESILATIQDEYKNPIKKEMLKLVGKQKPSLRSEIDADGGYDGIEGIIFTNLQTKEKFKVVDKDVFTAINKFNYQVRKSVAGRIVSSDPDQPIDARGGIVGEARLRSVKMLGLENAELPTQSKRILLKFKGDSKEETINNIADSLHQLSFESIKRKMQSIYATSIDDLEDDLSSFKTGAHDLEHELPDGTKIKYTKEIRRRTLLTFAEAKRTMLEMLLKIKKCGDMYELVEMLFARQLDEIHGDINES